jgi:phosphoglycolate phosphatase
MSAKYKGVMFDLDGTLLNTLRAIANAANHMMEQLGMPTRPRDEWLPLIGHGLQYLLDGSVGTIDASRLKEAEDIYVRYYQEHGTNDTTVFPGIVDLLEALQMRGIKFAICSNKPDWATRQAAADMLGRFAFDAVQGQVNGTPVKPDPALPNRIAEQTGIPIEKWLYVGDSDVDMQTARNAGMFAVGVAWGYRSVDVLREHGADAIVESAREILDLL